MVLMFKIPIVNDRLCAVILVSNRVLRMSLLILILKKKAPMPRKEQGRTHTHIQGIEQWYSNFFKKLDNGPISMFKRLTVSLKININKNKTTKFFYCISVTVALSSLLSVYLCLVPFWTTQPSYHESHQPVSSY